MRKVHREKDLAELNKGIVFSKIKIDKEMQDRLRTALLQSRQKLEQNVTTGTVPFFGYPPICYSPRENKQEKTEKAYLQTFMKHVFADEDSGQTVTDIIKTTDDQR